MLLDSSWSEVDAAGLSCEGALFQSAELQQVSLVEARGTGSVWDHARLTGVDFGHATLSYARFDHASGGRVGFRHARLDHASFHNTRFVQADLHAAQTQRLRGTSSSRLAAEARALALETA